MDRSMTYSSSIIVSVTHSSVLYLHVTCYMYYVACYMYVRKTLTYPPSYPRSHAFNPVFGFKSGLGQVYFVLSSLRQVDAIM